MLCRASRFPLTAVSAALALGLAAPPAGAEDLIGYTHDRRTVLAFDVDDAAAQAWLPEGWALAPFGGPFEGGDLLVVLIDRLLSLDAEGKPTAIAQFPALALVSRATAGEESRVYVTRIYAPDASLNAYSNTLAAALTADQTATHGATGTSGSEAWSVEMADGGAMRFSMAYAGGTPGRVEGEALPYSSVKPDFHRIYRYTQLADLVMSESVGVNNLKEISFESSIAELEPLFNGNERLLAVLRLPVYQRETWLH